jgi:hypothetical protein
MVPKRSELDNLLTALTHKTSIERGKMVELIIQVRVENYNK